MSTRLVSADIRSKRRSHDRQAAAFIRPPRQRVQAADGAHPPSMGKIRFFILTLMMVFLHSVQNVRKGYSHPSNMGFYQMKFDELVDCYVLQVTYKNVLPLNIKWRFVERESNYNLKRLEMFVKEKNWNNLEKDYKNVGLVSLFETDEC